MQPPSGRRQMRICFAVVFFWFFCFFCFFRPPKLWDNRSREWLNGFSWNFHQTIGGECSLKRCAAAWRKSCRQMANVDDLLWDNRSRERLNRFSWNFHQTVGGNVVWNVVPPLGESRAATWRMLMLCVIYDDSFAITRGRHVIYAMTLVESPEGATGGCVIQRAGELM